MPMQTINFDGLPSLHTAAIGRLHAFVRETMIGVLRQENLDHDSLAVKLF